MPDPRVTVVTPSFNQGRFIRATIESVLSQDYPNLEYIVMDGGSTDETASVVRDYAGRLTWISERDRGQSHAINKGFRLGRGEILSWLNSDDVFLPGAVATAVTALQRSPRAGAVYGEVYLMDVAGKVTGRFPATEPFNLWKLIHLSDYILQQTAFFRRSVLDEVGYLDERLHYVMDWDLLIRIAKRHRLEYVPQYMGCLREYPEAKSSAGGFRRIRELGAMLRFHTGRRWPLGLITYGLREVQETCRRKLERPRTRWLRPPAVLLNLGIYLPAAYIIMRILRDAQGLYPDRWAGPRLRWMLPPGQGAIVVRGNLPSRAAGLAGQRLRALAGGRMLGEATIGFGDFEICFEAPDSPSAPLDLEFHATRWIRPKLGSETSLRRLCYVLRDIDWAEA